MAKVYVGTYKKYNNGSLAGAWLDLAKYESYNDFISACRKLHSDERDPEYMIQDSEGFPDGLDCMEWLSEDDFNDVKNAMKDEQKNDEKTSCTVVDYSDKAFAVIGDTKAIKDDLKKMGGRFNPRLSCGAGWIFSNKKREEVENYLSSGRTEEHTETLPFVGWLKEFMSEDDGNYYKKYAVGAVKIDGRYWTIEKPSIENRFCFHDEGPDYEFYKTLIHDEKKMADYFKAQNLDAFDCKIEHMTEGDYGDTRIWKDTGTGRRIEIAFHSMHGDSGWIECNDQEREIILQGLKFGREQLEKRLDSYLKKYGISKIHTWTYWADA